uniref:Uncharacterized protein n=1 Tax=Arundo donax TaxID=35708 RepID=A0A0A9EER0_ARUDO
MKLLGKFSKTNCQLYQFTRSLL